MAAAGHALFEATAADLAKHGGKRRSTAEIGAAVCARLNA